MSRPALVWLGLNRNTVSVAGAGFLMALGEELWKRFPRNTRSVGLYYLVRSLSITPAALLGALLWRSSPTSPFMVASGFGLMGALVFAATVDETAASGMMR